MIFYIIYIGILWLLRFRYRLVSLKNDTMLHILDMVLNGSDKNKEFCEAVESLFSENGD